MSLFNISLTTALRRMVLVAVLAGAAVSCSNLDDRGFALSDDAITLSSFALPCTKGYVTGTAMEESPSQPRTLWLTAWYHRADGFEEEYFRGQAFAVKGDGLWHRDPVVFWPLGGQLDFTAYSAGEPFSEAQVNWDRGVTTDRLALTVDRARTQDDILFGFVPARTLLGGSTVSMTFKHSQAWLEFRVRAKDAASAGVVTLHEMYVKDIYTTGELSVIHPFGLAEGQWSFRFDRREDTVVDDVNGVYGSTLQVQPVVLDWLLPEQKMKNFVMRYSLAGGDMVMELEFTLPDSHWRMGRKYVYDIIVSPRQIEILPSVLDWDAVPETYNI